MDIEDFILDVELLENNNPNVEQVDTLPFMKFIQHFRKNLVWEQHLRKDSCAFLELVSLEEELMWKRPLIATTDATLIKKVECGIQRNSIITANSPS
jgi:hypothetical protein